MNEDSSQLPVFIKPNPTMLKIVVVNLILWLFVIPLLGIVLSGQLDLLPTTLILVSLTPLVLIAMVIQHFLLWLYWRIFWFVQGCLSLFGILFGLGIALFMIFNPQVLSGVRNQMVVGYLSTSNMSPFMQNVITILPLFILASFILLFMNRGKRKNSES